MFDVDNTRDLMDYMVPDRYNMIRKASPIVPMAFGEIPDLKEICAINVAVGLWNQLTVPDGVNSAEWMQLKVEIRTLIKTLPIPKTLANYTFKYAGKLSHHIKDWMEYHNILFRNYSSTFHPSSHIPDLAWHTNGTIDYKKTAINLSSSPGLNQVQKYKLLCTYCLENELAELAPALFKDKNNSKIFDFVDFSLYPLLSYWNLYFTRKLQNFTWQDSARRPSYMFPHAHVDNWHAKEYFFDRLNPEEKVQGAVSLIDGPNNVWYQKLVLSKLTESELINVYMQRAEKILSNYSSCRTPVGRFFNEILSTWFDIRDMINRDQFVSIFSNVLESPDIDTKILADIWSSARDDFKQVAIYHNNQIVEKIFQLQIKNIHNDDDEFLFMVLSDISIYTKKRIAEKPFFGKYCDALFEIHEWSRFQRLVEKCVRREEVEQFRQNLVLNSSAVKKEFLKFYSRGEVEFLNQVFTKLLPSSDDLDFIQKYKKDLLMSPGTVEQLASHLEQTWSMIDAIMADGLPIDDLRTKFRRSYHRQAIAKIFEWLMNNTGNEEFLLTVLSDIDVDIRNDIAETQLFENYYDTLLQKHELVTFERVINACVKPEELERFRQDLVLFSVTVKTKCLEFYSTSQVQFLNDLLTTLLPSRPDLVEEYKSNILATPENVKTFANSLEPTSNVPILDAIMVDSLLADDVKTDFKKRLIFSPSAVSVLKSWLAEGKLNDVKRYINRYLESNRDKKLLKKRLIKKFEKKLAVAFRNQTLPKIKRMLLWCLDGRQTLEQYQEDLKHEVLFNRLLHNAVCTGYSASRASKCDFILGDTKFMYLNRFLNWYWDDPHDRKLYKLDRIWSYENIPVMRMMLSMCSETNESMFAGANRGIVVRHLGNVLRWIFEDDQRELDTFKRRHSWSFPVIRKINWDRDIPF